MSINKPAKSPYLMMMAILPVFMKIIHCKSKLHFLLFDTFGISKIALLGFYSTVESSVG